MRWLRGATALLCSLAALSIAAAAYADSDPPGKEWLTLNDAPVSGVNIENTNELGLLRTSDGVLHALWVNNRDDGTQALIHSAIVGTAPDHPGSNDLKSTVLVVNPGANQSFNDSVDLAPNSGGGLRALFSTTFPGSPIDSVLATSTSADSTTWSAPVAASATAPAQRSPVYAASGIAGAIGLDGTTYSTWGDSSPDGGGYHVGLAASSSDLEFSAACCEIDPNIGVDSLSGSVFVAANLVGGGGIQVRSADGGTTATVPKSASAWTQQRTSISGRIGAPGVYVAWGTGDNMFDASPALWAVGAPKFRFLKNQHDVEHVGLAPAPDGRIWVYWSRDYKIYASRTNPAATKFGAIVKLPAPFTDDSIFRLAGEGSLGPLDIFALIQDDGHLTWWRERLAPGLTLETVGSNKVKPCETITFRVTDAGDPVKGIKVFTGSGSQEVSDTSNGAGKAKLKISKGTKNGKTYAATKFDAEYTDADASFTVKG